MAKVTITIEDTTDGVRIEVAGAASFADTAADCLARAMISAAMTAFAERSDPHYADSRRSFIVKYTDAD